MGSCTIIYFAFEIWLDTLSDCLYKISDFSGQYIQRDILFYTEITVKTHFVILK